MAAEYKRSYRWYPAWNYRKEVEDLNRASEDGWQLVKGGCFHSRFVKNTGIRYRYQLDSRKVDDMARYIETFREQGWEYVNSTFNGWHYFRKLYDPALPEEAYEIFTDRESLHEMQNRWARAALWLGIICAVFAVVCLVRMILRPHLPVLVQLITFAIESAVMLRGGFIMRNSKSGHSRRGEGALFAVFLAVIFIGCAAGITLTELRPNLSCQQNLSDAAEPLTDNRWLNFDVKYPDYYYLDLDMDADVPFTFALVTEDGEVLYSETGTDVHKEDVHIRLAKGQYRFSETVDAGATFDLKVSIS